MSLTYATRPTPAPSRTECVDRRNETAYAASRHAVAAQYFDAVAAVRTTGTVAPAAQPAAATAGRARPAGATSLLQTSVPLPWSTGIIAIAFAAAVLAGLGLGG